MSGSISQKRRRKSVRQRSKEEIRWYIKFFADMIEEQHENVMFPNSEYTTGMRSGKLSSIPVGF